MTRFPPVALLVPTLCAALLASTAGAAEPDTRTSLVVDLFEVPSALRENFAPSLLTDLLLDAGKQSPRYRQLVPNKYLRKVLDRYRLALQAGELNQPPKDVEPDKVLAERMLLPSVSKLGERFYVTAALIDLRTFKRIESYKLDGRGEGAVPGLIEELWKKVDVPRTRWTYAAGGRLVLGPVVSGSRVIFATGKHWASLEGDTGRVLWKEPVTQPPPVPTDPRTVGGPRPPQSVQLVATERAAVLVTHQFYGPNSSQVTLEARDLATGKSLWTRTTSDPFSRWLAASKSNVFYVERSFDLVALDAVTGKEAWKAARLPAERYDSYALTAASEDRLYALHANHFLCFDPKSGKPVGNRPSIWEGAHHPVGRRVELRNLIQVGDRLYGYQGGKCYALHESGVAGTPQPLVPTPSPGGGRLYPQDETRTPAQDGTRVFFVVAREFWDGVPGLGEARFDHAELHVSARTLNGLIELIWHQQVASSKVRGRAIGPVILGDMALVGLRDHLYGVDRKTGKVVLRLDVDPPVDSEMVLARGALVVSDTSGTVRAIEP